MARAELRGMLLAEFDHIVGHKITFQVPEQLLQQEVFDAIHEYVIAKPNLCGRLMTMYKLAMKTPNWCSTAFQWKVLGYPLCLEGPKYPRNMLIWNICMLFSDSEDPHSIIPYEPVLRKLQQTILTLEQESEFLLKSKHRLQDIVQQVYQGLREKGECRIPVDDANTISLKLMPHLPPPTSKLKPHMVPVLVRELNPVDVAEWDMSMQKILPYIDGVNHIKRISKCAGVQEEIVLNYYGFVELLDIFQYSNVYATTRKIREFATNKEMQRKCLEFIAMPGHKAPPFETVFALYCSLQRGITMQEFCTTKQIASLHIDERKFVAFGVINGFLRRIHQYPLKISGKKEWSPKGALQYQKPVLLNGQTSYDQICAEFGFTHDRAEKYFYREKHVVILSK